MLKLAGRQLARGATPFLHVMCTNARAHQLYLDMSFRDERITTVRVVQVAAPAGPPGAAMR